MKDTGLLSCLRNCRETGTALLAFNIQNIEHLQALSDASSRLKLPAIAQLSAKYAELEAFNGCLPFYRKIADQGDIYLHLDHCDDPLTIASCILGGFDSVMFDGSHLPLSENIALTNRIKSQAANYGCLVEAELGHIGGVEDDFGTEGCSQVFDRDEFIQFCQNVGAELVAPAIGNAHGFYKKSSDVQIDRLAEARSALKDSQFLVLHGATGLPEARIRQAISHGVVKVNVSTDLKSHTRKHLLEILEKEPLFDRSVISRVLHEKLMVFFENYMSTYSAPCSR